MLHVLKVAPYKDFFRPIPRMAALATVSEIFGNIQCGNYSSLYVKCAIVVRL